MVRDISDKRIQKQLIDRAYALADEPEKQGTHLTSTLSGYRSCRAVGQRYRIIYRIDADGKVVVVAVIGIRRDRDRDDIYSLARRLLRQGLLD
ncbi:MAG: type II toxin-antitoxin system RelE/ParE family toxin [SAR202 cluster bacterium]|nr:type II toxin-antitoxin system RelE/ParE family toxin [SAR202 cluster bacterium]